MDSFSMLPPTTLSWLHHRLKSLCSQISILSHASGPTPSNLKKNKSITWQTKATNKKFSDQLLKESSKLRTQKTTTTPKTTLPISTTTDLLLSLLSTLGSGSQTGTTPSSDPSVSFLKLFHTIYLMVVVTELILFNHIMLGKHLAI